MTFSFHFYCKTTKNELKISYIEKKKISRIQTLFLIVVHCFFLLWLRREVVEIVDDNDDDERLQDLTYKNVCREKKICASDEQI